MKVKRIRVSLDLFIHWFMMGTVHYVVIESGVPVDAEIIATEMLPNKILELTITSNYFEEVPNDSLIPELIPVLKNLRTKERT